MSLPQAASVDPRIWQICAGPDAKTPKIHSKVYYFPRGHLEHACPSPNVVTITILDHYRPSIPCIISAVDLLVDPRTDEVFAKLLLTPITDQEPSPPPVVPVQEPAPLVSYVKTLTQTDINNVLVVPREFADLMIFPKLDLEESQNIFFTDLQSREWGCNYSYLRPGRHRLSTGWTYFVREKKLVAKDSVVFIKNSVGKIIVGIRRNTKFTADEAGEGGGNLTESAVLDAVKLAGKNTVFEVVYYPTARNWCNFVVDANLVDEAMKISWASGMRVKLSLKKEESSNSKPKGTISFVFNDSSNVPNWRMLEVNLDGTKISQNPWQVEVCDIRAQDLSFPSTKTHRHAQSSSPQQISYSSPPITLPQLPPPPLTSSFIPMPELSFSTVGSVKRAMLNRDTFPDGTKVARPDHLSVSDSSNVLNDKGDGFVGNSSMAGLSDTLSDTALNNDSPKSADFLPHNHNSLNSFGSNEPCTK